MPPWIDCAGEHHAVGIIHLRGAIDDGDYGSRSPQPLGDRHQVAGAVVDNGDARHVDPLVEATPLRRGSTATASRSARAIALNAASAT